MHLIGISGSLRRGSYNSALLRAAAGFMPDGTNLDIRSIAEIPLYNGDVEAAEGVPPHVAELKDAIAAADGLLIVTPEYNKLHPGSSQERGGLAHPPGLGHQAGLGRETRGDHRCIAREVRHDPEPECVAARDAYARSRTLDRRPYDGRAGRQPLQRGWRADGRSDADKAATVPGRFRGSLRADARPTAVMTGGALLRSTLVPAAV